MRRYFVGNGHLIDAKIDKNIDSIQINILFFISFPQSDAKTSLNTNFLLFMSCYFYFHSFELSKKQNVRFKILNLYSTYHNDKYAPQECLFNGFYTIVRYLQSNGQLRGKIYDHYYKESSKC